MNIMLLFTIVARVLYFHLYEYAILRLSHVCLSDTSKGWDFESQIYFELSKEEKYYFKNCFVTLWLHRYHCFLPLGWNINLLQSSVILFKTNVLIHNKSPSSSQILTLTTNKMLKTFWLCLCCQSATCKNNALLWRPNHSMTQIILWLCGLNVALWIEGKGNRRCICASCTEYNLFLFI